MLSVILALSLTLPTFLYALLTFCIAVMPVIAFLGAVAQGAPGTSQMLVVSRPVASLKPDPSQPRKSFPEDDLRALGESLRKKQLVPLLIRSDGTLVDGERRWRAAQMVSLAALDCIVVPDNTTPEQIKEIQLITALHRADLKPYEVFCGFVEWLRAHPGKGGKDLAAAIDRSETAVSMTLSLSRCIPAVQQAAKDGKIGLKDWYGMSQATEEQQGAMLAAKLNGATLAEVKKARKKPDNVRTSKVRCNMPSGVVVTVVGHGKGMTLSEIIEELALLLKEAKRAEEQGLDSKTFSAVLRDKASKAG